MPDSTTLGFTPSWSSAAVIVSAGKPVTAVAVVPAGRRRGRSGQGAGRRLCRRLPLLLVVGRDDHDLGVLLRAQRLDQRVDAGRTDAVVVGDQHGDASRASWPWPPTPGSRRRPTRCERGQDDRGQRC